MIRKTVDNVQDALKGVKDGMTVEYPRMRYRNWFGYESVVFIAFQIMQVSMISDWDYFYKINRLKR